MYTVSRVVSTNLPAESNVPPDRIVNIGTCSVATAFPCYSSSPPDHVLRDSLLNTWMNASVHHLQRKSPNLGYHLRTVFPLQPNHLGTPQRWESHNEGFWIRHTQVWCTCR